MFHCMFGIGFVFYNSKKFTRLDFSIGSIAGLIFGAIFSIRFTFNTMNYFTLIVRVVVAMGGLDLFLRSLKSIRNNDTLLQYGLHKLRGKK